MQGGGASVHGRSLFQRTTTTGNRDKTHLLMCDGVGPVVCEGSAEKEKKTISDGDQLKGTDRMFVENVGVLSDRW